MPPEDIVKLLGQVSDSQQKTLDLLDKLAGDTKPKPKDGWDKFQIVSSFVAGVLLVIVGGLFTYWYNSRQGEIDKSLKAQQIALQRIDLVSKFMPYLAAGEDVDAQRIHAVAALGLLGDRDLALFLAAPRPTTRSAIEISKVQSKANPNQGRDIADVKLRQAGPNDRNNLKIGHTILFDGFKNYSIAGFNFDTAKIVPWGTDKPDLEAANPDPEHLAPAVLFLENDVPPYTPKDWPPGKIPANAGIVKMPQQSLETVVEAPESGYTVHYYSKPEVGGVYCVRTWDGQHFAKIKITDVGVDRLGFDWVYQPSGSHKFE
jgi:hypothetical protein